MKQGIKKQLVFSATVGGIFLFAPVVLAAEEQNARRLLDLIKGAQKIVQERHHYLKKLLRKRYQLVQPHHQKIQ